MLKAQNLAGSLVCEVMINSGGFKDWAKGPGICVHYTIPIPALVKVHIRVRRFFVA